MSREQAVEAINKKREELIKIGMEKGLTSDDTVRCSQELDRLLNYYHGLDCKTEIVKTSTQINRFNGFLLIRNEIHRFMAAAIMISLKTLTFYR